MEIKNLDKKKMDDMAARLYQLEVSLNGLGSLFQYNKREMPLENEELFGIGALLKALSREASCLEDMLCDGDSGEEVGS